MPAKTLRTHTDFAPRYVRAVYQFVLRPLSGCRFVGFAGSFGVVLSSWSRFVSCSSDSTMRFLSCTFAAWLMARPSRSFLIAGCTYSACELWLLFVSRTMLVDDVEALASVHPYFTLLHQSYIYLYLYFTFPCYTSTVPYLTLVLHLL